MTAFSDKVIQIIKAIPRGKVATYGQIAALAGNARGSRGVGWLLHSSTVCKQLPWQRVINSKGNISFPFGSEKYHRQKSLLTREGVKISEHGFIDLKTYAWQPDSFL